MTDSEDEPSALAQAYGWVARMMTIVLEMVLPGLGGQWLDSQWGTGYLTILGFGLGFTLGLIHLLYMVQATSSTSKGNRPKPSQDNDR